MNVPYTLYTYHPCHEEIKVTGMIKGENMKTPKNSVDQRLTLNPLPPPPPPSKKNAVKCYKKLKIKFGHSLFTELGGGWNMWELPQICSLFCEYSKKFLPKKLTCRIFLHKKIWVSKISNPKKLFGHSYQSKFGVSPWELPQASFSKQGKVYKAFNMQIKLIVKIMVLHLDLP